MSSLGVAHNGPVDAEVLELVYADFPCECSAPFDINVLCGDGDLALK